MNRAEKTKGPYAVYQSGGLFVVGDTRTGSLSSYPTTRAKARAEAKSLNEQFAGIMAEEAAKAEASL